MKKHTSIIIFILVSILFLLTSCTKKSIKTEPIPYKELQYDVYAISADLKEKIGTLLFEFILNSDNTITLLEKREYSVNLISQDKKDRVENSREYLLDSRYSLIKMTETEKINSQENFNSTVIVNKLDEYVEIVYTLNSNEKTVVFPNNEIDISIYTTGQFNLIFYNNIKISEYNFYYNATGFVENFFVEKKEILTDTKFRDRECYIVQNYGNVDNQLWIDIENKLILQKQDYLADDNYIQTELISIIY